MVWPIVKLGDISEVITKGTTPTSVGFKFIDKGINFVKVESIDLNGKFLPSKFASISDECNFALKRSQLIEGDILFSIAGALGRTALVTSDILPANTNQALAIIRIKQDILINKRYLLLALNASVTIDQVEKHRGGVAQQNLSLGQLKSFEIPLPSLSEQKRIVAILDQAFADLEQVRAKTEQNLKNARELFDSYLQQVFSQKGEGWVEKSIADITTKLGDGLHGTPKYSEDGEYYFINGNNLNDGVIEFKERTKKVSKIESDKYKKTLNDRTILISINGTLGNVAFYNNEKVVLGKSACYFNLKEDINKEYVKLVIESQLFQDYAERNATGATIKNVSLKSIRAFLVPIAPTHLQSEIVNELNQIKLSYISLDKIYKAKLAALDELKKSILQKAFNGELTAKVE